MPPKPKPWIRDLLMRVAAGDPFHITDTETSGSSASRSRVIELATVTIQRGEVIGRFETLINSGVSVPSWITGITGINTRMLKDAPPPEEALQRWREYLGDGGHFVAHNAPFDWGFMQSEFTHVGQPWPFTQPFCTVRLARHCLPHLPSRSLGALITHYGIQVNARHRALADAEATAEIFLHLVAQLQASGEWPGPPTNDMPRLWPEPPAAPKSPG